MNKALTYMITSFAALSFGLSSCRDDSPKEKTPVAIEPQITSLTEQPAGKDTAKIIDVFYSTCSPRILDMIAQYPDGDKDTLTLDLRTEEDLADTTHIDYECAPHERIGREESFLYYDATNKEITLETNSTFYKGFGKVEIGRLLNNNSSANVLVGPHVDFGLNNRITNKDCTPFARNLSVLRLATN